MGGRQSAQRLPRLDEHGVPGRAALRVRGMMIIVDGFNFRFIYILGDGRGRPSLFVSVPGVRAVGGQAVAAVGLALGAVLLLDAVDVRPDEVEGHALGAAQLRRLAADVVRGQRPHQPPQLLVGQPVQPAEILVLEYESRHACHRGPPIQDLPEGRKIEKRRMLRGAFRYFVLYRRQWRA